MRRLLSPTASLGFGSTAIQDRTTRFRFPPTLLLGIQYSRAIRCRCLAFGLIPTPHLTQFASTVSSWGLNTLISIQSRIEVQPKEKLVRITGLEPARLSALPPQSSVSANSTICAPAFIMNQGTAVCAS